MSNVWNSSKNARNSTRDKEARMRREVPSVKSMTSAPPDVLFNRVPVYRDLNPIEQMLPQMCEEVFENGLFTYSRDETCISLPKQYYRFNSVETSTLFSILLDTSHARLARMLDRVHTRAMWREDRYYQIVDDPQLHFRSNCNDLPAFHNRVVLYLTTLGVLIYLRRTVALSLLSRLRSKGAQPRSAIRMNFQEQRQFDFATVKEYEKKKKNKTTTPFSNIDAFQYATYVHCYNGDILRFQLDFLAVKRNYEEALPILMEMGWQPNSPSLLLYRRRYYQYLTPFLDWVDMFRYQLKTSPSLSITGFYDKLLDLNSEQIDIGDLRLLGQSMVECIELRRLTRHNCPLRDLRGLYAGRRVGKDRDPRNQEILADVFRKHRVVRPVLHHACSPMRRFLFHLNYYDRRTMVSLPQMLALIDYMLHHEFFTINPICRISDIQLEPMIFQIYDFIWSIRQKHLRDNLFLRQESWDSIRQSKEGLTRYQRWDVFNSICLLFSICQNAVERGIDGQLIERLIRVIIDALRKSEFLESFMTFSYFDTYLALTSAVNCVPSLSFTCYQRVMLAVPIHLCGTLSVVQILNTFSQRFWRCSTATVCDSAGDVTELPRTMREISDFLMTRRRRRSVRQAPVGDAVLDAASGMSALGSTGAIVVFYRDFKAMPFVSPDEESDAFDNDTIDAKRRTEEQTRHLAEFRQMETDYRHGQIFADAYHVATGRPKIFFDETMKLSDCKAMSLSRYISRSDYKTNTSHSLKF